MMQRQRPYRVGDRVVVRAMNVYPLPKELRDGQEVEVVEFLPGHRRVSAGGREYVVAMANIDSGWLPWRPRPAAGQEPDWEDLGRGGQPPSKRR